MPGRTILLAALALGAGGIAAHAAGGGPTAGQASSILRLPNLHRCVKGDTIRVSVLPPAGESFASLTVRAGSRELLHLADLSGPGTTLVPVTRRGVRVEASATTTEGRFVSAVRRYRRCRAQARTRDPQRRAAPRRRPVGSDRITGDD